MAPGWRQILTSGEEGLASRELFHAELLALLHAGREILLLDAGQSLLDGLSGLGDLLLLLVLGGLLSTLLLLL